MGCESKTCLMVTGSSPSDGSQSCNLTIISWLMSGIKFTVANCDCPCQTLSVPWDVSPIQIVSACSQNYYYHIILAALVDILRGMSESYAPMFEPATSASLNAPRNAIDTSRVWFFWPILDTPSQNKINCSLEIPCFSLLIINRAEGTCFRLWADGD